jgi:hypothetical protein
MLKNAKHSDENIQEKAFRITPLTSEAPTESLKLNDLVVALVSCLECTCREPKT